MYAWIASLLTFNSCCKLCCFGSLLLLLLLLLVVLLLLLLLHILLCLRALNRKILATNISVLFILFKLHVVLAGNFCLKKPEFQTKCSKFEIFCENRNLRVKLTLRWVCVRVVNVLGYVSEDGVCRRASVVPKCLLKQKQEYGCGLIC